MGFTRDSNKIYAGISGPLLCLFQIRSAETGDTEKSVTTEEVKLS